MKSLPEALWCTQTVFLSKRVLTTVAGRRRGAQTIEVPGAYTLLRDLVLQETPPGAKRPPRMASAFVGKYASVTAVDLIQWKKLDSRNFYESNLTEARFDSLPFYSNNYGNAHLTRKYTIIVTLSPHLY